MRGLYTELDFGWRVIGFGRIAHSLCSNPRRFLRNLRQFEPAGALLPAFLVSRKERARFFLLDESAPTPGRPL